MADSRQYRLLWSIVTYPVVSVTLLNPTTSEASLDASDVHLFDMDPHLNQKTHSIYISANT